MYVPQERQLFERQPIDRSQLVVPEVLVENLDTDPSQILKPCFDAIWNASGLEGSIYYDENGKWLGETMH